MLKNKYLSLHCRKPTRAVTSGYFWVIHTGTLVDLSLRKWYGKRLSELDYLGYIPLS